MGLNASQKAQFRQYLEQHFNLQELKDLAFDLGVDPEYIGEGKEGFARKLITSCERLGKLDDLIKLALARRPNDQIATQSTEIPTTAAERPAIWVGVPPMPNHFVGRDEQIADLVQRLTSGDNLALSAEGLAGVGKTTLAVKLAYEPEVLAHFKDGVLWAGLGPQGDVFSVLNTWAEALGIDVSDLTEEMARQQAVRDKIGQRRILLVIDDVWDIQAAERLRCGGPFCCHLLTTRDKGIARQFAGLHGMYNVQPLEDDPAFALLQQLAPEACAADPKAARALAQAVGGLPLALELLGSYLTLPRRNLHPKLSQEAMSRLMDPRHRLQLAKERLGTPGQEVTLHDTILLSLEGLRELEDGEAAERAFYALGAFAPKPEQFGWEAAEAVAEAKASTLALLVERNLLETSGEQLALHQTLADAARMGMDEATVDYHCDYYVGVVNEDRKDWRRIEQVYGQLKWAWQADLNRGEERLLDLVGVVQNYQELQGLWRDQLEWTQRGLMRVRTTGNREGEGMLLNNMGGIYSDLGQREQAIIYFSQALPILEELGDRGRGALAATLNNIGIVYHYLGQQEQALYYYNQALQLRREISDQPGLATTLNNMGLVYHHLGQLEQALDYLTQTLMILKEVDDPLMQAKTLNNLGLVYHHFGRQEQALDYYNRALPILEEVGDRAMQATTLNNIGLVCHHLGQHEEALEYYLQALPILEEVGNRAMQATTLHNLGSLYDSLKQPQMALDYFSHALPIREEVSDHGGRAITLNNLGLLYDHLGQSEKALDFYNRALPILEKVGDRRGLATTLNNLGLLYDHLGQSEKALDFFNRTLPILEEVGDKYGEGMTRYNLALILREEGRLAEAVAHLRRTVELDRLVQHPHLESDMALLAQVEAEWAAQGNL